jgi:Fic family protein
VCESTSDAVKAAQRLFEILGKDQKIVTEHPTSTVMAIRLFQCLPEHPIVTISSVIDLMKTTKPTASKAIEALCQAGILYEITGKRRDRAYAYRNYLRVLTEDTDMLPSLG